MGEFENDAIYNELVDTLMEEIDHFERQTEAGFKFYNGSEPNGVSNSYNFYVNEVTLGDNTFLVNTDETKRVFISHNILNYLGTADNDFCNYTYNSLHNLMQKSYLISNTGEKERKKFFNGLRRKVTTPAEA
jgi:hypothetical protein